MPDQRDQASEVLEFWFVETRPHQWFAKEPAFDDLVQQRFLRLTRRAIAGDLDAWDAEPTGALALVLLLDQFPRQIWRDTAMAFAGDPQALALSQKAVELGWVAAESAQARRQFWLMPLMHSEDLTVQEAALPLFERFADPRTADFARLGAGVERGGAGFSADAGLPLLKRLSAQRGREAAATGARKAANLAAASAPRA